MMRAPEIMQRMARIATAFSPGAPVDKYRLFAGRTDQAKDVMNAITQRGQHVIIYGERGVGKTSLANVLSELLSNAGFRSMESGTINCDATDDFASLWRKIFRELSVVKYRSAPGFNSPSIKDRIALDAFLPEKPTPDDIRYVLQRLDGPTIIIVDEMDRIRDQATTTLLADTIKTLSDHSVPTTLILVGVADSVDQLIAEHKSIERALVQVRMPRMSPPELFEIIDKGLREVGMRIDEQAKRKIGRLSEGLPHYTHLLALHAAQEATGRGRTNITMEDVDAAIRLAVDKAQQSILSAYHKATSSPRKDNLYAHVLLASALAPTDELGYFAAADVREPMTLVMKKRYDIPAFSRHLNDFCEVDRGPVLQKTGTKRKFRFRFVNPLMQPFVIMHGLAKGLVTEAMLRTRGRNASTAAGD